MQNCNYEEVLEARWRIKERNLMKRHLRERIQLLSRQRDEKLKHITAKRNIPSLTDDEVEAIENQLTSQTNLESRQEVNCSLIGIQNKEDRKELKRKPAHEDNVAGMILLSLFILALVWKWTQEACPHWLPGNHRAKRRRRRKKRREKQRRLLRPQGLEPSLAEDPYRHTWDRERGRNYSSSEEEDGFQVLTRAWAHQETPLHSTPIRNNSPHRRHALQSTPEHIPGTARRRTNRGSPPHWQRYRLDAHHVDSPCSRRTRSLEPSSATAHQGTRWEDARSASKDSLLWTPSPRERTYRCPDASCRPKWRQQWSGHTHHGQCNQEQKDGLGREGSQTQPVSLCTVTRPLGDKTIRHNGHSGCRDTELTVLVPIVLLPEQPDIPLPMFY